MKKHRHTGISEAVRSLIPGLLKQLFGEIAEEHLEALALALLESRLRLLTWKGGYKLNQNDLELEVMLFKKLVGIH